MKRVKRRNMKTLLIAPQVGLQYAVNEVQHVVNALHPQLLMGEVTLNQVVTELQRTEYDVIWFATHGDQDGILLDDGALTSSMLAQLVRSCPPRLLFLNTCSSFDVAMVVHDSADTPVIGTICNVPDRDSFVTGAVLARVIERQIASGQEMDVAAAYQESKPGQNRQYIMLNGSVRLGSDEAQDDLMKMLLYLMKKQDDIVERLSGENETLHHELALVNQKIDSLSTRFHPRLTRGRLLVWALGYFIFCLAGLLFHDEIADWLGLRWYVVVGVESVLGALAGLLLMYGLRFSWDKERKDSA